MSSTRPRVIYYHGIPAGEYTMPTCGVCRRMIRRDEQYAGVLYADDGSRREARHATDACLRYTYGVAHRLVPGAEVYTHRYTLTEWGGQLVGRITARTEEFDSRGWRVYLIEPADPSDTGAVDRMREHPEEFFRRLARGLFIDPEPRRVAISDTEWLHYVLPA